MNTTTKELIDRIESLSKKVGVLEATAANIQPVNSVTLGQLEYLLKSVRDNQKINAIKLIREITHLGLKEAKDFVELHYYGQPVY